MLTTKTQPLEVAARVLTHDSITELKRGSFGLREWKVADRWASSTPTQLAALEAKGQILLLDAISQQAHRERTSLALANDQLRTMTEEEYLQQAGIELQLQV